MNGFRTNRFRTVTLAAAGAVLLPLSLAACSSGTDTSASAAAKETPAAEASMTPSTSMTPSKSMTGDQPFGSGCTAVPKSGSGSFDGMAQDPVATAASNNPALSTLVSAVKKAGLVDTLNNAKDITVFAPTNAAFAKIPKADLDKVLNDKATLTKILTYHVVGKRLTPADLSSGTYDTLEKSTLTTSGSGDSYKINDTANVVCGNVQTANATVYIIDTVLMPK